MELAPAAWVSLRDIAARAGVSRSTVSMALRNHPDISPATRERVQRIANDLNYRPNPSISRVSRRRGSPERRGPRPLTEIALVSSARYYVAAERMMTQTARRVASLQEFAAGMGYRLTVHCLTRDEEAAEAMGRKLYSRGCEAVIVGPLRRPDFGARFPWRHFSAVGIGGFGSCELPPVHTVMDNPFHKVEIAWRELRRRGYRRPGLALLWEPADTPERDLMQGAWLRCQAFEPLGTDAPPPLVAKAWEVDALLAWIERHRVDAVVCYNETFRDHLELQSRRWPEGVGRVELHCGDEPAADRVCGFIDTWNAQMKAAIRLLDQEIRLFQRGLPEHRQIVHVDPVWVDGPTLRPLD